MKSTKFVALHLFVCLRHYTNVISMNFHSKLVENAVGEFSKLPGIGKKTALRLVLHLLKAEEQRALSLSEAVTRLRTEVKYCKQCHNISDTEICRICTDAHRDRATICVVAQITDLLAIENTGQYSGLYHVLGGLLSPMEGIAPSDLSVEHLVQRVTATQPKEVILALNATMDGDTTAFYISKRLKDTGVRISSIARGVPVGGDLEYADEVTLGRSIAGRVKVE